MLSDSRQICSIFDFQINISERPRWWKIGNSQKSQKSFQWTICEKGQIIAGWGKDKEVERLGKTLFHRPSSRVEWVDFKKWFKWRLAKETDKVVIGVEKFSEIELVEVGSKLKGYWVEANPDKSNEERVDKASTRYKEGERAPRCFAEQFSVS